MLPNIVGPHELNTLPLRALAAPGSAQRIEPTGA